jgi:YVTN family beta-propeller protein
VLALALILAFLLTLPLAHPAQADGGAPNLVYIAGGGTDANDLVVVDIGSKTVTAHIAVGGKPRAVVLSSIGRFGYVTQSASNRLAVVDVQAKRISATIPVGAQPTGIAWDSFADTNRLFVVNSGGDTISVADVDAGHVITTIPTGHIPTSVAVASPGSGIHERDSAEVYVTDSGVDAITVIDDVTFNVITTIAVSDGPESIVIPQSGGSSGVAYVGTRAGAIVAIRLVDYQVLGTLLQLKGGASGQMDYNATNGQNYVPDAAGGVVQVLRPASPGTAGSVPSLPAEPLRTLPFPGGPAAVAIPNDGSYAFIAARETGRVVMYDLSQRRTVATLNVGGTPSGMVTGPYPLLPDTQPSMVLYVVLTAAIVGMLAVGAYLFVFADRRRTAQQLPPAPVPPQDEGITQ